MSRTVFTGLFRTPRYAGQEREIVQSLVNHPITYAFPLPHLPNNPDLLTITFLLAPIPPCPASTLTKLGHVVDECVSFTVSIQISQLGAAVQSQIVDTEPSLTCTAGIEQGALGEKGRTHIPPSPKPFEKVPLCYIVKVEKRHDLSHPQPLLALSSSSLQLIYIQ